jgi:hypothetical protein
MTSKITAGRTLSRRTSWTSTLTTPVKHSLAPHPPCSPRHGALGAAAGEHSSGKAALVNAIERQGPEMGGVHRKVIRQRDEFSVQKNSVVSRSGRDTENGPPSFQARSKHILHTHTRVVHYGIMEYSPLVAARAISPAVSATIVDPSIARHFGDEVGLTASPPQTIALQEIAHQTTTTASLPEIISLTRLPEPAPIVQPNVPCPVLSHRLR